MSNLFIPSFVSGGALDATGNFYVFRGQTATSAPSASNPVEFSQGARMYRSALLTWQWAGTSTPNGTFQIDGCNQAGLSTDTWYPIYLDPNKVYGFVNNAAYTHAGGITISVNSAVAGYAAAALDVTFPYLRITWTSTSGGAATGFTAAQALFRCA